MGHCGAEARDAIGQLGVRTAGGTGIVAANGRLFIAAFFAVAAARDLEQLAPLRRGSSQPASAGHASRAPGLTKRCGCRFLLESRDGGGGAHLRARNPTVSYARSGPDLANGGANVAADTNGESSPPCLFHCEIGREGIATRRLYPADHRRGNFWRVGRNESHLRDGARIAPLNRRVRIGCKSLRDEWRGYAVQAPSPITSRPRCIRADHVECATSYLMSAPSSWSARQPDRQM